VNTGSQAPSVTRLSSGMSTGAARHGTCYCAGDMRATFLFGAFLGLSLLGCSGASTGSIVGPAPGDGGTANPVGTEDPFGTSSGPSSTSGADGGGVTIDAGAPCSRDEECPGALCNWRIKRCAAPAVNGAPCSRDEECAGGLCNWRTKQCADKGALGAACSRDEECQSALCNWRTYQCSKPGAAGAPCSRDEECTSAQCVTSTKSCK